MLRELGWWTPAFPQHRDIILGSRWIFSQAVSDWRATKMPITGDEQRQDVEQIGKAVIQ